MNATLAAGRLNGGQHNGGQNAMAERAVQRAGMAGSSSASVPLGA